MIEAFGGRKFLAWLIQMTVLLFIFIVLVVSDKLTEGMFIPWLSATVLSLGIFVQGNAAVDKAKISAVPMQVITSNTAMIPSVLSTTNLNKTKVYNDIPETHVG